MTLIERIHEKHERDGRPDPACLLCEEAAAKAARGRPAWLGQLTAKELTTRRGIA
jgi:phosphoribosyl-dephospho-CoA transferase